MVENILVTGGSGFVMRSVLEKFRNEGVNVVAPTRHELDFTDLQAVRAYVRNIGCDVFIHAGAYTNVSKAREEFEDAKRINGHGTQNVAIACEEERKRLVLISTNYVIEDCWIKPGLHNEESKIPDSFTSIIIGYYAGSKVLSEKIAMEICSNLSIVRIGNPFGNFEQKDYVTKMISRIQSGGALWSNAYLTLTYLPDLSLALKKIISLDENATFHVSCSGITTPYGVGKYIVDKTSLDIPLIEGSFSGSEIPQYGNMDATITQNKLDIQFHAWQEALDEYLEKIPTSS